MAIDTTDTTDQYSPAPDERADTGATDAELEAARLAEEEKVKAAATAAAKGVAIGSTISQMDKLEQQAALQSRIAAATAPVQAPAAVDQAALDSRNRVAATDVPGRSVTLPYAPSAQDPEALAAASAAQSKYEAQQMYNFYTKNGMSAGDAMAKTGVDLFGTAGRRAVTPTAQTKTHFGPNGQIFQETGGVVKEVRAPNQGTRVPTDSILRGSIASERAQINALEKAQSKTTESDPAFANNSYLLNQHRTKLAALEAKYEMAKQGAITAPATATGTTAAIVQAPRNRIYEGDNIQGANQSDQAFLGDIPSGARAGTMNAQRAVVAPTTTAQTQQVTSQAQYDALPRGATYIGKDGKRYRKP